MILLCHGALFAWEEDDLFTGGKGGYHTYRIPALVVTEAETVLAFCEGRKNSHEDVGDIDLLLRRSHDGGQTWTPQQIVFEEGGDAAITIGNPVPVVARKTDAIHLLFTRNYKRIFHMFSDDQGASWSKPHDVTASLADFDYPWVLAATGPGHGIQTREGRLVVPIWLSDRERTERYKDSHKGRIRAGVIYSDDGKAWHAGGLVPAKLNRLHEGTVAERQDGTLALNMRARAEGFRAVATSADGGQTWSDPVLDRALACPTCQGSLLSLADSRRWVFANPAVPGQQVHSSRRRNLTLRLSHDEGRTWSHARTLHPGPAGYSDLAVTKGGAILCLYESGSTHYREKISLARLSVDWFESASR